MALLDHAIRWLEPVAAPRRHIAANNSPASDFIPRRVRRRFLTSPSPVQPLHADTAEYQVVDTARAAWRRGQHGAVAFLGAFGTGKTTLLKSIKASLSDLPVLYHNFASRILGEGQLLGQLGCGLGLSPDAGLDDLAASLQAGPRRIVLLDDCHLLFLRRPGGFAPLDSLLWLISTTDRHVLWITSWNTYSWMYLKSVRGLADHFVLVHPISALARDQMQQTLTDRVDQAALPVVWPKDEEEGIFRTIWTNARGRPALGQHIFLHSLRPAGDGTFTLRADTVCLPPQQCEVTGGEEAHALDNLVRHSALSARELASINHISKTHAAAILARTTAKGFTLCLDPDYRLNPMYADAVVAYLDSRRAISFREVQAG
ncbi:MAG: hypothetical protein MAG451_00722 [Anaerolineales bacterium]|nr:hypothetical protein [Anaerolineales bacterium]